jgi:hypothetical protein
MSRSPCRAVFAAALLAALAALALPSCRLVAGAGPRAVVALDEAFAEARPRLRDRLLGEGLLRPSLLGGLIVRPLVLHLPLSGGAGPALDAALAEEKRGGKPVVLVTSPLAAKAILGAGSWRGEPAILVPEMRDGDAPAKPTKGLWIAATDPIPAYRAAGAVAGAYVAALAVQGGTPSGGLLFAESPARPRAAREAYVEAFGAASGGRRLIVRELANPKAGADPAIPPPGAPPPTGSPPPPGPPPPTGTPPPTGSPPPQGTPQKGSGAVETGSAETEAAPGVGAQTPLRRNSPSEAEAAVNELLSLDIRTIFIALGPSSAAAIRAADRPGLAVGAEIVDEAPVRALACLIQPDEEGLAKALASEAVAIGRGESGGGRILVPARFTTGPAAASIRVGGADFAHFIEEFALGAAKPGEGRH